MPKFSLVRVSALALTLVALPVLSGCGSKNPFTPPPDLKNQIPPDTPANDTPQNTMLRFKAAYQYQDITNYKNLLTEDFRYTFSSQTDPALANYYGNNWGKIDEVESAKHLLTGFTNTNGDYVPPASQITITFNSDQYLTDPSYPPDSSAYYAYVPVGRVIMAIDVPTAGGSTTYNIDAQHNFYLVRGDAALLDGTSGQPADANHWYIRHWDDLSAPTAAVLQMAAANAQVSGASSGTTPAYVTWGGLKDQYLK